MYKPHTIEQYKVYRFLEENFALEHFLLAPLSRFGLILEDKTGEKIAFAFLNNCVQEIPVPAPAAPETVTAFLKQFRSLTPHPVVHDFEALTRWWLNNPNQRTVLPPARLFCQADAAGTCSGIRCAETVPER